MRLEHWVPGVGIAVMIAVTSTVLASGWPKHGHGLAARAQVTAHVADARSSSAVVPSSSRGAFQLTVRTSVGKLRTAVAPLRAAVRSDGTVEPIDPPHGTARQWDTAAWIEQSAYPASPKTGPSYVYGHACHYHVCPFTRLTDVAVGDTVTVRTSPQLLSYRVCSRGLSPKADNLLVPACRGAVVDLVLVTCQYEQGDTSVDNLVVVATLTAATRATP